MTATPENVVKIFTIGINFLQKHEWCQRSFAFAKNGRKVPFDSKDACFFCASSAIERGLIQAGYSKKLILQAMTIASNVFIEEYEVDISVYNDRKEMTKEKVIQAFTNIKSKYERIAKEGSR